MINVCPGSSGWTSSIASPSLEFQTMAQRMWQTRLLAIAYLRSLVTYASSTAFASCSIQQLERSHLLRARGLNDGIESNLLASCRLQHNKMLIHHRSKLCWHGQILPLYINSLCTVRLLFQVQQRTVTIMSSMSDNSRLRQSVC